MYFIKKKKAWGHSHRWKANMEMDGTQISCEEET